MSLFSRHPLVLQTAYSETKRRGTEQALLLPGTAGSVGEREVRGRRFLYRQFYDAEGKKDAEYIGPVGDEAAEARARELRAAIDLAGELARETRLLARQGYVRVDGRVRAILAALANAGLFRAGAVLVGSHAYGALLNELGVRGAAFLTEDVDIARGERLDLATARDGGFAQMLADSTVPLHPIPPLDRRSPPSSYRGPHRLRVDLLAPARGEEVTVRAVPELEAHATAVPFLGYLLESPFDAVVLGREGPVPVKVPQPERFTWHKMLVSQRRRGTREKAGKDLAQAALLFAVLAEDAPDSLRDARAALPRGAGSRTRAGAKQVLALLVKAGHERAGELLAPWT